MVSYGKENNPMTCLERECLRGVIELLECAGCHSIQDPLGTGNLKRGGGGGGGGVRVCSGVFDMGGL